MSNILHIDSPLEYGKILKSPLQGGLIINGLLSGQLLIMLGNLFFA